MSENTYRFLPIPTISALDLALIIAASGGLQNVSFDFVQALPWDVSRHFSPNGRHKPAMETHGFILDEDAETKGAA